MATSVKKQIKNATKATKTSVDSTYQSGAYEGLNSGVDTTANTNIQNATTAAESAYKKATENNAARAEQSHATNKTVTKQIGTSMKKGGYSLTARNVASAASARSASTINTAKSKADSNAELTRDTSVNKAKASQYEMAAKNKASNTQRDIERSTEQNKTKAQQSYEAAEAKKERNLKNALNKREDNLTNKKRKYEKKQRKMNVYVSTLEKRYKSVKSVNKAIKKVKKNKGTSYKTKLAYLRALRAQLKQDEKNKKKKSSGGSGRRRSGYSYGRRYGSNRKSSSSSSTPSLSSGKKKSGKTVNGTSKAKIAYQKKITKLWANKGRENNGKNLVQPNLKKQDKKAASTKKKNKGTTSSNVRWRGNTARKAAATIKSKTKKK